MLEVASQEVGAGGEVAVSGFSYTATVFIRFGQIDGPVLATLQPTDDDIISGTVRIPEATVSGRYVLYAVQQDEVGKPSRFPGQAALSVVEPGGPPLEPATPSAQEIRPPDFSVADELSLGGFLTIVLATFGSASLVTMVSLVIASRQRLGTVAEG